MEEVEEEFDEEYDEDQYEDLPDFVFDFLNDLGKQYHFYLHDCPEKEKITQLIKVSLRCFIQYTKNVK